MMIREQHTWRGILAIHREEFSSRYTQAGHAEVAAKPSGCRKYGRQFGRTTAPKSVSFQRFVGHGTGPVATPICRGRAIGSRAIPTGAKRRTTRRNDESHECHRAQNSQWPARVPDSPGSWHSFITLRPRHRRVNRAVARRSLEQALQSP